MLWFYLSGIKLVMAKNVLFQWTSKYSSSTNTPEAYIHLKRKYSISQKTKEDVDGAASQYTTHPPVIILWYSTSQKALVHQHVTQQSTERPRSLEMENPFAHKKAMPRLDRFMGLDRLRQQICRFLIFLLESWNKEDQKLSSAGLVGTNETGETMWRSIIDAF